MHRIDHSTLSADENGTGKDGFTEGTPGTVAATVVTDDWLNDTQEEIANAIEDSAGVLVKGTQTQLRDAIARNNTLLGLQNFKKYDPANSYTGQFYGFGWWTDYIVAVGAAGEVQTLALGANGGWARQTLGAQTNTDVMYVPFLSKWCLVGWATIFETATDPTSTWTAQSTGGSCDHYGIACSSSAVIFVGSGGQIWRTTNGTSFAQQRTGGSNVFLGVFFVPTLGSGSGRFIAYGNSGLVSTSDNDGVTWTDRTLGSGSTETITHGWYDSDLELAFLVGTNSEIQSATEGTTDWTRENSDSNYGACIGGLSIYGVAAAFSVTTGSDLGAALFRASDGSWSPILDPRGTFGVAAAKIKDLAPLGTWFGVGAAGGLFSGLTFFPPSVVL